MRVIEVDERDSTWERDDPRFRIYIFTGADNAVATFDVLDGSVDEALAAANELSHRDEQLWSLALVENDTRGLRGLLWLSGMDYNDAPSTAREWRQRRQMQDRYLRAKRKAGAATVLPNGLRLVRVFPEWVSGWPLWESFTDAYRLNGEDLGLSAALSAELYEWNETWANREPDDPLPQNWEAHGLELVRRLQGELAGVAEVRPEFLA